MQWRSEGEEKMEEVDDVGGARKGGRMSGVL